MREYCQGRQERDHLQAILTRAEEAGGRLFLWRAPAGAAAKPEVLELLEQFNAVVLVWPQGPPR